MRSKCSISDLPTYPWQDKVSASWCTNNIHGVFNKKLSCRREAARRFVSKLCLNSITRTSPKLLREKSRRLVCDLSRGSLWQVRVGLIEFANEHDRHDERTLAARCGRRPIIIEWISACRHHTASLIVCFGFA